MNGFFSQILQSQKTEFDLKICETFFYTGEDHTKNCDGDDELVDAQADQDKPD